MKNTETKVSVVIQLDVSTCEGETLDQIGTEQQIQESVLQGVKNALLNSQANGFVHHLNTQLSLMVDHVVVPAHNDIFHGGRLYTKTNRGYLTPDYVQMGDDYYIPYEPE